MPHTNKKIGKNVHCTLRSRVDQKHLQLAPAKQFINGIQHIKTPVVYVSHCRVEQTNSL